MFAKFSPKTFDKLGKGQKDFCKKKYTSKKQFSIKTSADKGKVEFESTIEATKNGSFQGNLKVTNDLDLPGNVEVELDTTGSVKATLKLDKVSDGAKLKIEATQEPNVKVTGDYAKDSFNATATVNVNQGKTTVDLAGVVGFDGLSVGGHVTYDTSSQAVKDYNAATEYVGNDFVATVKTQDSADEIIAAYCHSLNHDVDVGARFTYNLADASRLVEVGAQFRHDKDTTSKVKGASNGKIDFALEQTLGNPAVLFTLGLSWNANKKSTTPTGYGASFEFGGN